MTTNHPANGPLSLDRLHQIREILRKASAQSDGGNLGYAMADAVKVIDGVMESMAREQVRREHAAWSQATFGDVGPVGPLKHLSKEALEAAAEPGDLSEWADMQFLLWDAQRRAGISDEQITQAMVEKLAVNKQREWPEPKDGEPRLHIKEQPAPENEAQATLKRLAVILHGSEVDLNLLTVTAQSLMDSCKAANSPVTQDGWQLVPKEPTAVMNKAGWDAMNEHDAINPTYRAMLAAAPQQENV